MPRVSSLCAAGTLAVGRANDTRCDKFIESPESVNQSRMWPYARYAEGERN
jgi:hypothetical protein